YKNVLELGSGSYLTVDTQILKVETKEWWNIHPFYQLQNSDSFETSKEKVDQMLHEGIRRRVESSDLEVGSFLSGGIDSGLVTAIASQYNKNLKTFTVSFEGEYDEAPLAKLVAEKYGTIHTTIPIAFTALKNDIEKIISNYGEPFFDSSAIPSYYVSCEARKHLTVILNGDGADELFGGYRRYVPFAQYDFFGSGKFVRNMAAITKTMMPAAHNKKSKYNYIYRLASLASRNSAEIYLSAGVDIFEDFEKHFIHTQGDYMADLRKDFASIMAAPMSGLKKLMNVDFTANLFSDLLVKMDIATMAHSLEGRSPFLCKELLEYVPSMNDQFKIKGRTTKYLLRELAKKYLPTELIHQPKRGFEIPLKTWVNHELKEMINDYILDPSALNKQLVDPAFVSALVHHKVKIPAEKRAKILYTLFSMEVWYKKVYQSGKS
ncbi:MAG: asparagine synthetase B family protein, partial [Ferruginibacter sp.]